MKHLAPDCFRAFACAMGNCPDSCCRAGWEIVIDPETRKRYEALTGPDGETVRAAVVPGAEALLRQTDGVCVLLQPDGLCFCQKHFGHDALCRVCREYPRFHREFGNLTEHGISLSCPTAFALAAAKAPTLESWEDDAPVVLNELDPERYLALREGRDLALRLLLNENRSLADRIRLVLSLSERIQDGMDGWIRTGKLACRRLSSLIGQAAALRNDRIRPTLRTQRARLRQLARYYRSLELLNPDWTDALNRFLDRTDELPADWLEPDEPELYARYLWFSLFKYWLDAADDGLLLARVRRSLSMTLLGLAMDRVLPAERSWLQRISREIEHCEENLEALLVLEGKRSAQ